jgi:glycosyltransferase involved in cell wall biosynthesis
MRITFACSVAGLSGGVRVIATLARHLRQRGHDVLVVSRPPRKLTLRQIAGSIYHRRPLPPVPKRGPTHLDGPGVPHKMVDRHRPLRASDLPDADIVVATWWETAEWVWALPAEKGVKVHFIQDYELWGGPRERVDATCRLPMPKITPARWVRELLAESFGQTDVTIVPNAVDLQIFDSSPRGKQAVPTVGFTYTTFRAKGCDITVEAIRLARQHLPELQVVCFGSTQPTAELPLPAGVEFHYQASDSKLKELYGRCDAWLFGTRREGFGLPILEAMACRTPVIGTPAGAAPDLLRDGRGLLIPPENPRAMADAILQVCAMPEAQWRTMSDLARAVASQRSWEDATDEFEAALTRARRAGGPAGSSLNG